ncbi:hypothetical protein [Serratia marcescens]|uniref:hypothetical protein n=1 Tax=Serratia marcescens TaxID=615 RepID=UPI001F152C6C|nr:hypothetical protein [Serratia marcescens]
MVQRYNPDYIMHAARFAPFARENEHGEFVKFSDYEALKAERDALAQRVEMLAHNLGNAIWGEQEALQQVNALAVDNAALKSRSIKLFNLGYLRGHESTVEGYFVDVHWCDIDTYHDDVVAEIIEDESETTATSAALAALQAQGVEKFAERMLTLANDPTYSTASHRNDLRDAGAKAKDYAAELREAK